MYTYRTTQDIENLITTTSAYMRLVMAEQNSKAHWRDEPTIDLINTLFAASQDFWTALYAHRGDPSFHSLEALERAAAGVDSALAMLCDTLRHEHQRGQIS